MDAAALSPTQRRPSPGIVRTSLPGHAGHDALATLDAASAAGFGGVLVASLFDVSPDLDAASLRGWRRRADALGLVPNAGLGWFNPLRPARSRPLIALGRGDIVAGAGQLLERYAELGLARPFFTIGMIEDRFDDAVDWEAQLDAVARGIEALAPRLRQLGVRLLLKTHEEITTSEILQLIERVGADVLGVALDPVNLYVRLEDPLAGARRVAAYVEQIHLDDADVRVEAGRLRRRLRPMGEGAIPWDAILALAPDAGLWVETHRGAFAMGAFDPAWLARQPRIALEEYAAVVAVAVRRLAEPTPDDGDPHARLPAYSPWLRARGI